MFKAGDNYIHFTKYGGINRGEVKWYGEVTTIDVDNGVVYQKPYLVTTKNIILQLDGTDGRIFKIKLQEEMLELIEKIKHLKDIKQ
jgi:hypothetical protein